MIKTIEKKEMKAGELKFYSFDQNNSGGSFVVDENLCHRLMIEAKDERSAEAIAESMGVYFNGCDEGYDCPCCGDRWYSPSEMVFPYRYGTFSKDEAKEVAESYDATFEKSTHKSYQKGERFDVIFDTPEKYSQYIADKHGWTKPDVRIFYNDGTIKEVYSEGRF